MITKSIADASLTKENEELAIQHINAAQALFPWLIGLTSEVRQSLPKMGKGGLDFVERIQIYGKEHPNLVTAFQNLDTQDHELELLKQIQLPGPQALIRRPGPRFSAQSSDSALKALKSVL